MNKSELRIGNIIFSKISGGLVVVQYIPLDIDMDNYGAVKLSEEYLLKAGFQKSNFTYDLGKLSICVKCREYENGRTYFNGWCISEKQPDFIHELQNLYFVLSGEELTIK